MNIKGEQNKWGINILQEQIKKSAQDVISVLRKEAGLTQEELGKKSKLSRIIIVKIENNQRAISLEEAINLSLIHIQMCIRDSC